MAIHAEALSVATTEFHDMLGALGIAQHRVARLFNVSPRSVRRWQCGDRRVPCGVGIVLRLLAAKVVTVAQVEQAAVPGSARTNSGAKSEPLAPLLLIEPARLKKSSGSRQRHVVGHMVIPAVLIFTFVAVQLWPSPTVNIIAPRLDLVPVRLSKTVCRVCMVRALVRTRLGLDHICDLIGAVFSIHCFLLEALSPSGQRAQLLAQLPPARSFGEVMGAPV
jgi:hypothetical protein